MSIPKVIGIEQEYAIKIKGDEDVTAFDVSCLLVNSYAYRIGLRDPKVKILWDYGHETPYRDIRGDLFGKNAGQQIISDKENRLINACLPNGARLYTDHAHPEYSTPECLSALDALACDKAGEIVLREGLKELKSILPTVKIALYKNNVDHQGHSYGCHENYLMAADVHEACFVKQPQKAVKSLVPFLVTRQIFAGSGMVGTREGKSTNSPFRISQRADFMEKLFGLETMYSRPIVNTRCEHHADPSRFRRLHLILGDANMCEFAAFLKLGTTQIVLQMLEDDFIPYDLELADPVKAIKQISENFNHQVELADGRRLTATQVQREYLNRAQEYQSATVSGPTADSDLILSSWCYTLDGLEELRLSADLFIEDDPLQLSNRLDWVIKLWIINRYREGRDCSWDHPLLRVLDLQYHNIDTNEGIFYRTQNQDFAERFLKDEEIERFVHAAPHNTRAWFRGQCLGKFSEEVHLVNWEVVGFDQGDVYRMVPLLNPLKGTREQFHKIFEQSQNARELIALLESGCTINKIPTT